MDVKFLNPYSTCTAAFVKEENDGVNTLLLDFGDKIGRELARTQLAEGTKRFIAFGTHTHQDHIGGIQDVAAHCEKHGAKLMFLLPDIRRQRNQMCAALGALGMGKVETTTPAEVADWLNIKSIGFDAMAHNSVNIDLNTLSGRERIDTTALIMTTKGAGRNKIIYASDNDDKKFVRSVLKDKALLQLFLEVTFAKHGLKVHQTLQKLEKIAKELGLGDEMKKRIVAMHFRAKSLPERVKQAAYSAATDRVYEPSFA